MGWWETGEFVQASWLFVRLVGVVATIAFVSLLVQVRGLYGREGIAPIADHLADLRRRGVSWRQVPSVFWLGATDRAIVAVATIGTAASLAVTLDVATVPALVVVAVTYLSFAAAGQDFLAFQWDAMLVEVAIVALLLAAQSPPHPVALLLAWVVAFRVVFSSGVAKLVSGDRSWRDLTALAHHHQTQPLPTRLAWHAHKARLGTHRTTTAAVLVLEVAVPVFLFAPELVRLPAVLALVVLQVGIAASGCYGFFNLLTVVMLVPLVPDRAWAGVLGEAGTATASVAPPVAGATGVAVGLAAGALVVLNAARLVDQFGRTPHLRWLRRLLRPLDPWRLVNRYGLFAVMTTARPEITVEGSLDGETWQAYGMRWKPGPPDRAPRWSAPHQPRLDWQMWFAALGDRRSSPWFTRFLERLLEASPSVLRLLAVDPFDGRPPRLVRARRELYTFTDRGTRRETGRWWEVIDAGTFAEPVRLHDGGIVPGG